MSHFNSYIRRSFRTRTAKGGGKRAEKNLPMVFYPGFPCQDSGQVWQACLIPPSVPPLSSPAFVLLLAAGAQASSFVSFGSDQGPRLPCPHRHCHTACVWGREKAAPRCAALHAFLFLASRLFHVWTRIARRTQQQGRARAHTPSPLCLSTLWLLGSASPPAPGSGNGGALPVAPPLASHLFPFDFSGPSLPAGNQLWRFLSPPLSVSFFGLRSSFLLHRLGHGVKNQLCLVLFNPLFLLSCLALEGADSSVIPIVWQCKLWWRSRTCSRIHMACSRAGTRTPPIPAAGPRWPARRTSSSLGCKQS